MFEFNYSVGDIKNSDLGEGIVCLGEGSGGKGEGSVGKGGGKCGKGERPSMPIGLNEGNKITGTIMKVDILVVFNAVK